MAAGADKQGCAVLLIANDDDGLQQLQTHMTESFPMIRSVPVIAESLSTEMLPTEPGLIGVVGAGVRPSQDAVADMRSRDLTYFIRRSASEALGLLDQKRTQILRLLPPSFLRVGSGDLCLTGRPGQHTLPRLKRIGLTTVVTLLSEKENAQELGKWCRAVGLNWVHAPLDGANRPLLMSKAARAILLQGWRQAQEELSKGGRVLVHCAAGVHRTGVFGCECVW